jgi:hypothetical protein
MYRLFVFPQTELTDIRECNMLQFVIPAYAGIQNYPLFTKK